ncbi:MAG: fused MFS/spermidine synthase [Myxococcales bacterium]|nr:fused MFS/spermidine synthase [Myxococcales bacterium]
MLPYYRPVSSPRARRFFSVWAPLLLFVISGATALVGQLCFSRYLSYIVGATAYAVSSVLAAFMAGLALGAHLAGRWAARVTRPLLAYGLIELAVATGMALSPLAFSAITPLYVKLVRTHPDSLVLLTTLRWALAFGVVLVPTTAMGATLPLLARLLGDENAPDDAERRRRERWLGALYTANTFGGALGALGAAYIALPRLGLGRTLLYAAAVSGLTGLIATAAGLAAGKLPSGTAIREPRGAAEPARTAGVAAALPLMLLALFSGLLVLGSEVVLTHLLALIIGNSAYAFGLILATFLACLAFGAALAPSVHRRFGELAPALALCVAALALALSLPAWDDLPLLFAERGHEYRSFESREALRGAVAFGILLIPTTAMGLTFPLLLQRVASLGAVSQLAGQLTAVNTVGAVVGSLLAGFVLLPGLGSQNSMVALVVALSFSGAVWAFGSSPRGAGRVRWLTLGIGAAGAALSLGAARWDLTTLTAGTNVYFGEARPAARVVSITEDVHGGVTTVTQTGPLYTLYTNGKFQGNNGGEMTAQRYFSIYPLMFTSRFDHAMVIGLGTGTSLGALGGFPFQRLTAVEISPAIVVAARRYFSDVNGGVLDDPRVRVVLDDGRHYLLVSEERYDLIGIELSSIWFAGASSLYSRDFYRVVRGRLSPGGVFQQWLQLHHMLRADVASILTTVRAEFPFVALFYAGEQGIIVASMEPLRSSRTRIAQLARDPRVQSTLPAERSHEQIIADCLLTGRSLDRFIDAMAKWAGMPPDALISTDDNVRLEFSTPRGNILPWNAKDSLVADMRALRDPGEVEALIVP